MTEVTPNLPHCGSFCKYCFMGTPLTLDNVLQLFVIIGGTVGITFKISWAIFQEIHNNKK